MTHLSRLYYFWQPLPLAAQLEHLRPQLSPAEQAVFGTVDCLWVNADPSQDQIQPLQIEDVRRLLPELQLRPLVASQRLVVIFNLETASLPAQHALLKVLEEPPVHVQILVTTAAPEQLLETVLSRVQLQGLTNPGPAAPQPLPESLARVVRTFPTATLRYADVFSLSESHKERTAAQALLVSLVAELHQQLEQAPDPSWVRWLQAALRARQLVDQNVNPRLALEQLLFHWVEPATADHP